MSSSESEVEQDSSPPCDSFSESSRNKLAISLRLRPSLSSYSGRGSLVVKGSDQDWSVMRLITVSLKTHRVGKRWALNLSRAQTSFRWCGS
ncbi:hypothetical protein TNCV_1014521 [Trichonephila clavipes]|uniref:Uncharacterized protein n=1 Tax=Trichonephila clavipes TaxID=2585209 RepID=A0A8X6VXS2_TRICX|nr:hypothetical protein TNCV_1014521 [Trichonephila clavipes]